MADSTARNADGSVTLYKQVFEDLFDTAADEEILAQPCVAAYIDRLQGAWVLGDGDAKGAYRTFEDVGVRRLPERTLSDEERRWYDSAVSAVVYRLADAKHAHEQAEAAGAVIAALTKRSRDPVPHLPGIVPAVFSDAVHRFLREVGLDARGRRIGEGA